MTTDKFQIHPRIFSFFIIIAAIAITPFERAFAAASGDGWMGPKVFDGEALNQSLHALNHHIQDKYAQDDMLAALIEPRAPEFAVASAASATAPSIEQAQDVGAFGYVVYDSRSLDVGLELFNMEVALRGADLFIQVALEATAKDDAFALAASSAGIDEKMAKHRLDLAGPGSGFGDTVRDDASLEASVEALNRRMYAQVEREIRLAVAVPPVDDSSFASVMIAMAYSY